MNGNRPLLVTTALEQSWGSKEELIFLGEWCRLYERSSAYTNRNYQVVPNHWDDRSKLREDLAYLDTLHESLLVHLVQVLNRHHRMNHPVRYWRMVMGPWLLFYLIVCFDRWECLRLAFESCGNMETIALNQVDELNAPSDYAGFVNQAAYSDAWNHQLFLQMIGFAYAGRCMVRNLPDFRGGQSEGVGKNAPARKPGFRKKLLKIVAKAVDTAIGMLPASYKITFVTSYFPLPALVRLSFRLGQLPRLFLREFEWPPRDLYSAGYSAGLTDRFSLKISRAPDSAFEAFLTRRITQDIPRAYVEDFPLIRKKASRVQINTEVICSANAHWNNELFKIWSAEQVTKGVKFVAIEHGGGIPGYFEHMHFERKVADKKVVSAQPYCTNYVRLPFSKLVTRSFISTREYCSVIGNELPRYCYGVGGPIAGQVLAGLDMVCAFYAGLDQEPKNRFRVKPYANLGWNTRQRYIDVLGLEHVYSKGDYYDILAQSRVVVCTYPQTTFSEAMATGLPTLLLYPAHFWENIPEMDGLLGTLRSANIVFHDPVAAARHLNRIWNDPEGWWGSPPVIRARQAFFESCLDIDKNWLKKWVSFLEKMAAE